MTLKRWRATGIPLERLEDVYDAIYELVADIAKEAAPSSTRRLEIGVRALESKFGITDEELTAAEAALELDARIAAELEASQRTSVEPIEDLAAEPMDESPDSRRQT